MLGIQLSAADVTPTGLTLACNQSGGTPTGELTTGSKYWLDKEVNGIWEALKDEGIFITFENFAPFSEQGEKLYLERWKQYQINNGKSQDESQKHIERYGMSYFPITISKHLELMKSCGFKAVEILWVSNMQVGLLGIK